MYIYKQWTGKFDYLKPYSTALLKHLADVLTMSLVFWHLNLKSLFKPVISNGNSSEKCNVMDFRFVYVT